MDRNNSRIGNKLKALLKNVDITGDDFYKKYLFGYQYRIFRFMTDPEFSMNSRGLVLYHATGSGKSRTASAVICECNMRVIVLCAKSLHNNFKLTIAKLLNDKTNFNSGLITFNSNNAEEFELFETYTGGDHNGGGHGIDIHYLSLDAYNSAVQLSKVIQDNCLIVVDEVHNLTSAIINSDTSNGRKIYNMLMEAKNLRLLLMTANPVIKNPFELVPLFNLICGYEILPPQYDLFNDLFVGKTSIKNKEKLANRLFGLVSYVSNVNKTKEPGDDGFYPVELPLIIDKIEMDEPLYKTYLAYRAMEAREISKKFKPMDFGSTKIGSKASGTYYIKSRTSSTYYSAGGKEYCNKLKVIADRVIKLNGKHACYSQFVNNSLIKLGEQLEKQGFEYYGPELKVKKPIKVESDEIIITDKIGDIEGSSDEELDDAVDNSADITIVDPVKGGEVLLPKLRYAIISGLIDAEERTRIIEIYNSKENINGELIKCIMLSKAVIEGITLKDTLFTHAIEPFWNISRLRQFIARAIRLGCCDNLDKKKRIVQPYLYLSVANKKVLDETPEEDREKQTIDEQLYNNSLQADALNSTFLDLLKSVSIDCYANYSDCYTCNSDNQLLYTKNYQSDIKATNPCICEMEEVKAIKVVKDGIEYAKVGEKLYVKSGDSWVQSE